MTASIWNPGGTLIPQADPNSQLKSEEFIAVEGQTVFNITKFTYAVNNGALTVYIQGVKQAGGTIVELSPTSFSTAPCESGDLVEVVGNTAIADATGAAQQAAASAAAALASEQAAELDRQAAEIAAQNAVNSAQAAADSAAISFLNWREAWAVATDYVQNDGVKFAGSSYICLVSHTSVDFAADLAAGKWDILAEKGIDGTGTGDMLASNNLSELTNKATARSNLGLDSAAQAAVSDFATSAQGVKADSALQSSAIGVAIQPYDAATAKLNAKQQFTAQQTAKFGSLTDASSITWDGDANGQIVAVTTAAARTFVAPANIIEHNLYLLSLTTGGFTPAWNTAYKWQAGSIPTSLVSGTYIFTFVGGAGNTLIPTGPGYLTGV